MGWESETNTGGKDMINKAIAMVQGREDRHLNLVVALKKWTSGWAYEILKRIDGG